MTKKLTIGHWILDISVDFDLQNSPDHNSYESEFNDDFTIQNNLVSHTLKKWKHASLNTPIDVKFPFS